MALVEDLALFTSDFGRPVVVDGVSVRAIFENRYAEAFDMMAATSSPRLSCPASAVPGVAQGSTVQIDAAAYHVTSVQPDGTGWVVLMLQEAVA